MPPAPKNTKARKTKRLKPDYISDDPSTIGICHDPVQEESNGNKFNHDVSSLNHRNSIRIGLVGPVSCGKSTLLNSICVNQYEDMKMKRTTMLPSVYKESNQMIYTNKEEMRRVYETNKEMNRQIYAGEVELTNENCNAVENIIPQIQNFVDLPENIYLDIYDVPGLDDAKTKDIYYKWIEDNFDQLDVIFHIVDINSPLNTSSEIDILKMIIKNIENEKIKHGREVFLLTIINKCDEMELDDDNNFIFDEEECENYEQIIKYTQDTIKEISTDVNNIHCEFTPISAADTFIYRMLHNDPYVNLDMKLLQKFGINEIGKRKWNSMTESKKREYISTHFEDIDINDTLKLTGYNHFKSSMNSYLTKEKQSFILSSRLKHELNSETLMNQNISKDTQQLESLIDTYNSYCSKIWTIDELYGTNNSQMVTDLINLHLSRWINTISDISNSNQESIDRLEDYKIIILKLKLTIDTYALSNTVPLIIEENKSKRWVDSFGFDISDQTFPYSMDNLLNYLFKGYGKLQNEFYIQKLSDISIFSNFPEQIYENINSLRQNSYDNVESTIDQTITLIKKNLQRNTFTGDNTPMDIYFEFNLSYKENTLYKFCNELITTYDYPIDKIIKLLKFFIQNRYHLLHKGPNPTPTSQQFTEKSNNLPILENNLFKSYQILFDIWIKSVGPNITTDKYTKIMKNLFIVNKSYINYSNCLDPQYYYNDYEASVLAIPMYLYDLMFSLN
jgi:GTPase Era involved in 16S rRNA processing